AITRRGAVMASRAIPRSNVSSFALQRPLVRIRAAWPTGSGPLTRPRQPIGHRPSVGVVGRAVDGLAGQAEQAGAAAGRPSSTAPTWSTRSWFPTWCWSPNCWVEHESAPSLPEGADVALRSGGSLRAGPAKRTGAVLGVSTRGARRGRGGVVRLIGDRAQRAGTGLR